MSLVLCMNKKSATESLFSVPVLKSGCTLPNCLPRLNLDCAQVNTTPKTTLLCVFSQHVTNILPPTPSVSVMAPGVQGKLPWRPTTPTAVWASPSMPGSEVRKTMQPYRDSGRQCIVGVLSWPRLTLLFHKTVGPVFLF